MYVLRHASTNRWTTKKIMPLAPSTGLATIMTITTLSKAMLIVVTAATVRVHVVHGINADSVPSQLTRAMNIDTYIQLFSGPLSGTTRYGAGTRKVKPIWILLKQERVSGSGISWAICKSAPRSRPRQHPTTQFFTGRMPFLPPNQQHQSTEGSSWAMKPSVILDTVLSIPSITSFINSGIHLTLPDRVEG